MAFQQFPLSLKSPGSVLRSPLFLFIGTVALAVAVSGCSKLIKSTPPASPATTALAEHLTTTGAKLYGTYWCPYCNRQEELFKDAIKKVQVVECDPKGENAQPQLCNAARVSSYPTWEINGKMYRGMRSLEELAVLSGYQGSTDFDK
ncbi:MAG: hypothetical protein IGS48_21890 [Oscillatoriales cyanobacterium C42_A2020_001]|nr:hypothetical protein [Leptolyngbyaceae cyanobacterium C42_A2020_001]